jgi:hypothetical protein
MLAEAKRLADENAAAEAKRFADEFTRERNARHAKKCLHLHERNILKQAKHKKESSTEKKTLPSENPGQSRLRLDLRSVVRLLEDGEALNLRGKKLIFFLGQTGAGKSTTINWLAGSEMKKRTKESNPSPTRRGPSRPQKLATVIEAFPERVKIGHGTATSETKFIKDVTMYDFVSCNSLFSTINCLMCVVCMF